jgi:hypothetical protein
MPTSSMNAIYLKFRPIYFNMQKSQNPHFFTSKSQGKWGRFKMNTLRIPDFDFNIVKTGDK